MLIGIGGNKTPIHFEYSYHWALKFHMLIGLSKDMTLIDFEFTGSKNSVHLFDQLCKLFLLNILKLMIIPP